MKKKLIWPWISLLVAPYPILVFSVVFGLIIRSQEFDESIRIFINIGSLISGVVAVWMIVLTPLWIVLLVLAIQHNRNIYTKRP